MELTAQKEQNLGRLKRPRRERLQGLAALAKSTSMVPPYWPEFIHRLSPTDHGPAKSVEELHLEYVKMVECQTNSKEQLDLAKCKRSFSLHLSLFSRKCNIRYATGPIRGYFVWLQPLRRRGQYEAATKSPPMVKYINQKRGHCLFATRPYEKGELIVQYKGEIISEQEYEKRLKMHEEEGISYRFIHLGKNRVLDGTRDTNGCMLSLEENPAAAANNSRTSPNAKLILCKDNNNNLWLKALTGISKGYEIKWWYGDTRKGLEGFMYE